MAQVTKYKYGPPWPCPCRRCYACDGEGCEKCRGGIRCSVKLNKWTNGLRVTQRGPRTVVCKIDHADALAALKQGKREVPR